MHHPSTHDRDLAGQARPRTAVLSGTGGRRVVWLVLGGAVLVLAAVVLVVPFGGRAPAASPTGSGPVVVGGSPLLGKPAPAISLHDLDGDLVTLAEFAGRPVIINIWASWCIPCRDEFPMLVGAYGEYRNRGLEVLGIVHDDATVSARAFAQQQGATWPMLLDSDRTVWRDYIGLGVPQSYFIDGAGIVRSFSIGPFSAAGLRAGLDTILPPAASPGGTP